MPDLLAASVAQPQTDAVRRMLAGISEVNAAALSDLLFLEDWENAPSPSAGAVLRAGQIRRANPELAAEIRAELAAKAARAREMSSTCHRSRAGS